MTLIDWLPLSKIKWLNLFSHSHDKSFNENQETVIVAEFKFGFT